MDFSTFHLPRWRELPMIPLYMDQVLYVLNDTFAPLTVEKDPVATPSAINSYVKAKLLEPPSNKKYMREHLAKLIILYLLKRVLLMAEIDALLKQLFAHDSEAAYDLFCEAFEACLRGEKQAECPALLEAALQACCGKLNVEWLLVGSVKK